jgi:SAM-dependent methyltransferase
MADAIRLHGEASARPTRVLLLGVTPRLADMQWGNGTTMLAVDASWDFLRGVWPGDIPGRRRAVQANWRALPIRDAACDVAIGDGSLNVLPYPDGLRAGAGAVRQALGPRGLLVVRLYVRPDDCESPEQLAQEVAAHRVETFHQFRFRLLMAMQRSARDGVAVRDVYQFWHDLGLQNLHPTTPGWSREDVEAIEPYRHSPTVHFFPALHEWRAALSDLYEELEVRPASYALGDRCPVIVLRSRS